MERRRSPRYRASFDALISAEEREGAGILGEISYVGARLDDTSLQPPVGSKIRLYIFVQPVAPFEIEGQVARHTGSGFAVSYELFEPEIRNLVDDVSAIVGEPRRAE